MADYSKDGLILWDYFAIGVYFFLNICVGIYALCRPNRGSISGYFLADRFMWWLPVGASLFASNIGSEHFIGLAGSGAAGGIGVGAFNFNSIVLLQLLGWIFVPVFIASGVRTVPEYMTKRFGGQRIQVYLAILSLILYIFTKISVDLYSGALFINQALQWNIYSSVFALILLTAVCTMTGGLAAVIYTDTLQFFIMIFGSVFVMVRAFQEVGGYEALQHKYMEAVPQLSYENSTCGVPRRDSWVMLRDPVKSDLPWPAFMLGQTPASIWYWCADQMMVQRVLSAKSLSHAQGATLFAAYIKILPFFLIILPGMISRVLYPDDVACVLPEECLRACGSKVSCYNSAYPRLVVGIMPPGLKGFMLAIMLAALMSDLTSIFNSASTMFTIEIWKRFRPKAKTKELLTVGKLFIVILVAVSVAWVPIIEDLQSGQLFIYIQKIGAYLSPPIACVYLMAVVWPRMNEHGAFWALMCGFLIGIVRMGLDFSFSSPGCNSIDTRPLIISKVNFMYFATFLFWLTGLCGVVISLLTAPLPEEKLIRTTYKTRFDESKRPDEIFSSEDPKKQHSENNQIIEMENMQKTQTTASEKQEENKTEHENEQNIEIHDQEKPQPIVAERTEDRKEGWRRFCSLSWLCGLDVTSSEEEEMEANQKQALSSIHQTKWEKLILNTNLVIVVAIGIGLFAYFSIDPFPGDFTMPVFRANYTRYKINLTRMIFKGE